MSWAKTPSTLLSVVLSLLTLNSVASAEQKQIESDSADGVVSSDPSSPRPELVLDDTEQASVGVWGDSNNSTRTSNSAILYFELPGVRNLTSAALSVPYVDKNSSHLAFNVDVWGLGYQTVPELVRAWHHTAPTDNAAGLGIPSRHLIQEDFLSLSSVDPNSSYITVTTSSDANSSLTEFFASLYEHGARPGDFAVLRLNPDAYRNPDRAATPGYRIGLNEFTEASPTLTLEADWIANPSDEVHVLANSTYLSPAAPREQPNRVSNAISVELLGDLSFEVRPGDYIRLEALGDFDFDNMGQDEEGPFGDGTLRDVWGVFSRSAPPLEPKSEPIRLDGVLPTAGDFTLVGEDSSGIIPDLLEDFIIPSITGEDKDGIFVQVPEDATHLFLGAADQIWFDNTDDDMDYRVRITRLSGECNGDGVVNGDDLACACGEGVLRDLLDATGLLEGDADANGMVDFSDFLVLSQNFGGSGDYSDGDFNCDGEINFSDFLVLSSNFGETSASSVPEPNSCQSAAIAALLFTIVFRRFRFCGNRSMNVR